MNYACRALHSEPLRHVFESQESPKTATLNTNKLSLTILFGLVFLILHYRIQAYLQFPFSAPSRLAFYGCLFLLVIVLHKGYLQLSLGMLALLGSVMLAGVHTALLTGVELAIHATGRFVNVMLLAPFVALLFTEERHMGWVLWLFWAVFTSALVSLLIQYGGGSLDALVNDYVAIRGDLIRHMTVVGEPNVGGMLAVIAFVSFVMLVKRRDFAVILGGAAVALVFFSISKAAILGMGVAVAAGLVVLRQEGLKEAVVRAALAGLLGLLLLQLLGAEDYARVSFESVLGSIRGEPSVLVDFQSRQSSIDVLGLFKGSPLSPPLSYLLGISFSDVGSAAQEIRGLNSNVFLPHNSYLELLLTGGALMLSIVLFLMARAFRSLWRSGIMEERRIDRCSLICLIILSCWMLVYPVIYEPVTGCLFWIIVGYGNRIHTSLPSSALLANCKGEQNSSSFHRPEAL